jgi:hypothetical protein
MIGTMMDEWMIEWLNAGMMDAHFFSLLAKNPPKIMT